MQKQTIEAINDSFVKGITEHFNQYHKQRCGEAVGSLLPNIENYLFCITATFYPASVGITNGSMVARNGVTVIERPSAMHEFGRMHFNINRYLLGNHIGRKRDYQPFTVACLDFEGSKFRHHVERVESRDKTKQKNIHVHAFILVHPATLTKFMNVVTVPHHFKSERMDEVTISRFNPEKGSIENWIDYSSKGCRQWVNHDSGDYWTIFPALRSKEVLTDLQKLLMQQSRHVAERFQLGNPYSQ